MLSVKVGEITQRLGKERAVIRLPLFLHKVTLSGEKGRGYIKGKGVRGKEERVRGEEQGEGKTVMNMNEENRKSRYKGRVKGGKQREKEVSGRGGGGGGKERKNMRRGGKEPEERGKR